ncbi:hypothetical protein GCM10028808_26900 [Spirosoma migulaei]
MRPFSFVILLLLAGLTGCQSSSQPEPVQYSVPVEVEPYLKSFRDEAAKRNKVVSTANLIVTFGTVLTEDVCGQCILENGKTPRIILNADDFCWKTASTNERECLVFHELGHCLLNRAHKTEKFTNGLYVSLMNPDNVAVYATCRYPIGGDECDKRDRRDYYINELFEPATPTPVWGK